MMKTEEAKEYIKQIREEYNYYQIHYNAKKTYGRIVRILDRVLAILEQPELMEAAETFATEALELTRVVDSLCYPFSNKRTEKPFFPRASPSAVDDFIISFNPIETRFEKLIANRAATLEQWHIQELLDVFSMVDQFDSGKNPAQRFRILSQVLANILELREEVGAAETFAIQAFELTRKVVDLWHKLCLETGRDFISPSDVRGFCIRIEPIEDQIKDLICRETGIGPPMGHDGPLVGLEEDVQLLTAQLVTDNADRGVVSIVGRQSIGKTTLAQKVYDSAVVHKHFDCHAWVSVHQDLDIRSVQLKIAVQVIPFKKLDKTRPVEELLAEFLVRNKYLIVLDDIQTPEDWTILEQRLPVGSSGGRIMITTCNRKLLVHDDPYFVLEKQALSDEEGWELFNARVGSSIPTELEDIGREIVMKCTGLPLIICEWADKLSKREATKEQWYFAVEEINQDQKLLYRTLKDAADKLDPNSKKCLFCFDLFRQDYEVPVRRVIAYLVAEESVQEKTDTIEPPERVAKELLMKLVEQNLITVANKKLGKAKTCRIHHLLRDNWLSKAKEANSSPVNSKGAASKSSCSTGMVLRLADHLDNEDECFPHIHGNNTKSSSLKKNYRELHSFISFDSREGPLPGEEIGNFFHKCIAVGCFKKLRVVDLEGVFRPKLPESIGKLTQLRYLGLRWTYLQALPSSVGKLLNIQTLDLKRTYISSLPASLWKLQQLRHLYLSEFFRCRFVPPPKNCMLMDLQTLWGAYVNEETPIKDGLDRLTNLRKLGLAFRLTLSEQKSLVDWIAKLNDLESLRLRSLDVEHSDICLEPLSDIKKLSSIYLVGKLVNPDIVHHFPESLTEITLSLSGLRGDPMPNLEKLPDLRILRLHAGSYCGRKMVCSSRGFPLLRILKLWKLEELEEWTVEEGALTILKEVEIRSCNKLEMIPDGLKHLLHCRELIITNMPDEFKARITESQGKDWHKIAHVPSIIVRDLYCKTTGLARVSGM
ncbi:unnamed protein product [Ilex paraguariensis]|uniref:NB-ARC domain-containing protein n=1 Tax=Ilex paraguariensis TaxID=185542 RepID=A0ABC8RW18_9AQUA